MVTIRTYLSVVLFLIYSLIPLQKLKRLRASGDHAAARAFQLKICEGFARNCFKWAGSTVTVFGEENIPKDRACVFVSNHQGIFDIHTMLGYTGQAIGLIAKEELKKTPIISSWMIEMGCIFIERGNPRKSLLKIAEGVEAVKQGQSMVIFPEGTRSKCDSLGEFKPGSLKLATKAGAPIVPVTINGTYHIFEDRNKRITPADVTVTFGAPIETAGITKEEETHLQDRVVAVIRENLELRKSEYKK